MTFVGSSAPSARFAPAAGFLPGISLSVGQTSGVPQCLAENVFQLTVGAAEFVFGPPLQGCQHFWIGAKKERAFFSHKTPEFSALRRGLQARPVQ